MEKQDRRNILPWQLTIPENHPQNCAQSENQQMKSLKITPQEEKKMHGRKCLLNRGSVKEKRDRLSNGKASEGCTKPYLGPRTAKYSKKRQRYQEIQMHEVTLPQRPGRTLASPVSEQPQLRLSEAPQQAQP